jgi:hypothetical protein
MAFRNLPPGELEPDKIHRFVLGEDAEPRVLDAAAAAAELADPFATLLLLQGTFPRTAGEVLTSLDNVVKEDSPLRARMFFLLGEGSQIPFTPETASVNRNLRFVVATVGDRGPDLLLSSFTPDEGDVELMAWDEVTGGFNYYRTVGGNSAWVFAGNSRHALQEPTEGKGPFESHPSGNFLMKELRAPWLHWHSPDAPITPSVFAENNPLRNHPWFLQLDRLGAVNCEAKAARPSIVRWTEARFDAALANAGTIERPARIIHQIVDTPTVNLITSHTEGATVETTGTIDLPQTFFIDSEALTERLGLPAPPTFTVSSNLYAQSLRTFGVTLTDGNGFARPGDTHFAFAIPERAFEDQAVLNEAIKRGVLTERFAACLLMTDFPNPVFSTRRAQLLRHVPASASIVNGASSFSEDMANTIVAAAEGAGAESPEGEFAARWGVGDAWKEQFGRLLNDYYAAVTSHLGSQEGFDAYFRLAESRRERVRQMPIFESPLLFAETNIDPAVRVMRSDGTVQED